MTVRLCDWCRTPLLPPLRADAIYCSKRCRQAAHRFRQAVTITGERRLFPAGHPCRLAYADPPYPGKARRYYSTHPDYAGEVDHKALLDRLSGFDGWALSTNTESLQTLLALAPARVRVAAWFRGARPGRGRTYPAQAWEPVLYVPARSQEALDNRRVDQVPTDPGITRLPPMRYATTPPGYVPDALIHPARPRTTDPARVIGAKPAFFARWIFDLLGALPGDSLDDLYPGSGGIARAWNIYTNGTLP